VSDNDTSCFTGTVKHTRKSGMERLNTLVFRQLPENSQAKAKAYNTCIAPQAACCSNAFMSQTVG